MTDADKKMNLKHIGSDAADIRIPYGLTRKSEIESRVISG